MRKLVIIFFLLALAVPVSVFAQDGKKSDKTQVIDGKKYYLHTVEKKQTLYQIAKIYGLEVNDIVLENPEAIDGIKQGQVLKIPASKPKPADKVAEMDTVKYLYHKVEAGQTVFAISRMYALKVEVIEALNPDAKAGLKTGQLIKLPKNPATIEIYNQNHPRTGTTTTTTAGKPETGQTLPVLDSAAALRSTYSIAFFLPFHLDEVDNIDVDKVAKDGKFPQKPEVAIEFYQGIRMALDSLKNKGAKIKAYFYDVDDRDSSNMESILGKPEFKEINLIVGPLYSANFVKVARFAKDKNIPIVSPLSQQNKILFRNPYVSKVTPAVTTQMEQMGEYIASKYSDQNIILLSGKDTTYKNPIKKRIMEVFAAKKLPSSDSIREVTAISGVSQSLVQGKTNIIIVPSNNRVYVTDILSKLKTLADKHDIIVFGMPSWNTFDNLDLNYLSMVHFHYVTSSYIDYDNDSIKHFVLAYRGVYHADPSTYVFQGYDVTNYYVNALLLYGLNFQSKLQEMKAEGLQTSFDFINVSGDSGYENKAIRVVGCTDHKQSRVD